MKRYNIESYQHYEELEQSFKNLKMQSLQSAIKQAKEKFKILYEKAKYSNLHESANAYYNACIDIGSKILAIKESQPYSEPEYKQNIFSANLNIEKLSQSFESIIMLYEKLNGIETSIKSFQRRTENSTDQIPLLKSGTFSIISDNNALQENNKNYRKTIKILEKKIEAVNERADCFIKIPKKIDKNIDFEEQKQKLEQRLMSYEEILTKLVNVKNAIHQTQEFIIGKTEKSEGLDESISRISKKTESLESEQNQSEKNLFNVETEIKNSEAVLSLKQNISETLQEKFEASTMALEDFFVQSVNLDQEYDNLNKQLTQKFIIKVIKI